MKSPPKPRTSFFIGGPPETATIRENGTWLEPESLCYPSGGMLRRCYALCEDGKKRVFKCGIPDTFFSILATGKINGKSVKGFISSDEKGFKFTQYQNDK